MKQKRRVIFAAILTCLFISSITLSSTCAAQNKNDQSLFINRILNQSPRLETIKSDDGVTSIDVSFGDQRFTRFVPEVHGKPIFYPIATPKGVCVTRSWPLEKDADGNPIKAGIANDHPHHKSLWFAHEVNGLDFWTGKGGAILNDRVRFVKNGLLVQSRWTTKDKKIVIHDDTLYTFGKSEIAKEVDGRTNPFRANWLDAQIKMKAAQGDIEFNDTKEGFFAIRTHPDLRLSPAPKRGVEKVFGHAVNSEGQTDKELWGQTAKWVMYYGPVDGNPVSILMCDHPNNFRHPTTWHARDYGLIAANPFGLHDFLGKPAGTGAVTIAHDQSLTLRYRVYFADGILDANAAEALYSEFR